MQPIVHTTERNQTMNTNDPKAIAHHISEMAAGTTVRRQDSDQDGPCWIVENATSRLAIGVDPIDGDGISWASYWITPDGQSDVVQWDGWAFSEDEIAQHQMVSVSMAAIFEGGKT